MEKRVVYFGTNDWSRMKPGFVKELLGVLEKMNIEVADMGFGSAYDMPIYLLGEMESGEYNPFVIGVYFDDEQIKFMAFGEDTEINPLKDALEKASDDADTIDVCVEVHKLIREEET